MSLPLSRVILYATNLEQLATFYRDVLGLMPAGGSYGEGFVEFEKGGAQLVLVVGGRPNDSRGAFKLCFSTPDVEATRSLCISRGATLAPAIPEGKWVVCDGVDPEGNRIQLTNRGTTVPGETATGAYAPIPDPIIATMPPPAPPSYDMPTPTPIATPTYAPEPAPAYAAPPPAPSYEAPAMPKFDDDSTPPPAPAVLPTTGATATPVPFGGAASLIDEARAAVTLHPDVFVFAIEGRPGIAIIFRDLLTRMNSARTQPIPQEELERTLGLLGGVGMMARIGDRHRRIVVFAPGTLDLASSKLPQPQALPLASADVYPLG